MFFCFVKIIVYCEYSDNSKDSHVQYFTNLLLASNSKDSGNLKVCEAIHKLAT
jgi:hypothetical protein